MAKSENAKNEEEGDVVKPTYLCCFPKRELAKLDNVITTTCSNEITSPTKIVYQGNLPQDLTIGSVIHIEGLISSNCFRFSVDLSFKNEQYDDIGFHFNPRLDRNYIVRNSCLKGHWGEEETTSFEKFNLKRNKNFDVAIFIAQNEYLVSVNGKHFCGFNFRVPLSALKEIIIRGNVEIYNVKYENWSTYPEKTEQISEVRTHVDEDGVNLQNDLGTPCTAYLPQGLQVGWQLNICGRVKLLPHSFYINLQDGVQLWPHPIIPLHLNPRFFDNVFVSNAWVDSKWGIEERSAIFQFSPGTHFSLAIRRDIDHFSVWLDGQLTGEFKFRGPVDKIDAVYIKGDVVINQIVLHERKVEFNHKKC